MKVAANRQFATDSRNTLLYYEAKSGWAADHFKKALNDAVEAIRHSPTGAGHLIPRNFGTGLPHRRRNLKRFPYFIVYTYERKVLTLLRLLPSRSNPQNWFRDFTTA